MQETVAAKQGILLTAQCCLLECWLMPAQFSGLA